MNRRGAAFLLATGTLALLPLNAYAQKVPWIVLPLAVSPLVAIILAGALGVAARSWSIGLKNTGLVIVWVVWFVIAAKYIPSDPVIWASIVALGLHCIVMLFLIVRHASRRARSRSEV
jgi:hypothetical protein